ncbi:MAG: hypothetical protein AAGI68_11775 [Planctomycetota bacterium]
MAETKTAFTPGPWEWYQNPSGSIGVCSTTQNSGDGKRSVVGYVSNSGAIRHQTDHNAHLIAAAPELYELLKEVRRLIPPHRHVRLARIDALLAKARGESE